MRLPSGRFWEGALDRLEQHLAEEAARNVAPPARREIALERLSPETRARVESMGGLVPRRGLKPAP